MCILPCVVLTPPHPLLCTPHLSPLPGIVMGSDAPVKLKVKRGTKFAKIFKAFYSNKGIAEKTVKCE